MPFTPTHIVAVLPFWPLRRVVPFSAFAMGAMIPDLPLFFPIVNYAQAHSPLGLLSLCLPLGMAGFFLFELVMRKPIIAILPGCLASRLSSLEQLSSEQQKTLLEKLHISDLCNYYLDPKLQEETETIIAGLLRGRGVQSCSSDGVDKTVPDR